MSKVKIWYKNVKVGKDKLQLSGVYRQNFSNPVVIKKLLCFLLT